MIRGRRDFLFASAAAAVAVPPELRHREGEDHICPDDRPR